RSARVRGQHGRCIAQCSAFAPGCFSLGTGEALVEGRCCRSAAVAEAIGAAAVDRRRDDQGVIAVLVALHSRFDATFYRSLTVAAPYVIDSANGAVTVRER